MGHRPSGVNETVVTEHLCCLEQVSGISTEIFRQIETVEKDHDATTAAALEAVERRGEMLVRVLDPRQMGRTASEAARTFLTLQVRPQRHPVTPDALQLDATQHSWIDLS